MNWTLITTRSSLSQIQQAYLTHIHTFQNSSVEVA